MSRRAAMILTGWRRRSGSFLRKVKWLKKAASPNQRFNLYVCNSSNFVVYGLNRNLILPRLALAFAFRRCFCEGVSKARKRRTSSRIPSASSLFFSRFNARSTGSPLRTITSGINHHSLNLGIYLKNRAGEYSGWTTSSNLPENRRRQVALALGERICRSGCFFRDFAAQGRLSPAAGARPPQDDGRGDKDRRVSADDHADDDGEGKVA